MPSDGTVALLFFAYEGISLHEVVLDGDCAPTLWHCSFEELLHTVPLHHIIDCTEGVTDAAAAATLVSVELGTTVTPETKVVACPLGEQLWPAT